MSGLRAMRKKAEKRKAEKIKQEYLAAEEQMQMIHNSNFKYRAWFAWMQIKLAWRLIDHSPKIF